MRYVQQRWVPVTFAISVAAGLSGCPDNTITDAGTDAGGLDTGSLDTGSLDTGTPPPDGGMPDGGTRDGGLDASLPTTGPTTFTEVASGTFEAPTDAVVSPDGTDFYFAAFDASTHDPAIFTVPADGSSAPTVLHAGAPFAYPSGLVLSADGTTIYVADPAADPEDDGIEGAIFSIPAAGGAPATVSISGLVEPNALALNAAGDQLFASGRTSAGAPAIFRAIRSGGAAVTIASGAPLVAPTGLFVDPSGLVWVLDHLAEGDAGPGVLFTVSSAGVVTEIASGLSLGTPGGVSTTAGGGTVIVGTRDEEGLATLTSIDVATGAASTVALPTTFFDPAGLRTARAAGVFALVDSEGAAIYRGN